MNELTNDVYKVNFKDIIANSLNREYWEKTWHLFEYDGYNVTMKLDSIDITRNQVWLRIDIEYKIAGYKDYEFTTMRLPLDRYNAEVFKNKLHNNVKRVLRSVERGLARRGDEYHEAAAHDTYVDGLKRDELCEFLDDEGVYNSEVREIYIDEMLDYTNTRIDVLERAEGNLLKHVHNMVDVLIEIEE